MLTLNRYQAGLRREKYIFQRAKVDRIFLVRFCYAFGTRRVLNLTLIFLIVAKKIFEMIMKNKSTNKTKRKGRFKELEINKYEQRRLWYEQTFNTGYV